MVSNYLLKKYPEAPKEWLHKARERLTRNNTLGRVGLELSLLESAIIGASLQGEVGRLERHKMVAGLLEGIVGAVFLEGGIRPARKVVLRILHKELETL